MTELSAAAVVFLSNRLIGPWQVPDAQSRRLAPAPVARVLCERLTEAFGVCPARQRQVFRRDASWRK